jgi:hypothetical protein
MRYSNFNMTTTHFVAENARSTAAELWAAVKMGRGNFSGNLATSGAPRADSENAKSPARAELS